MIPSFVFILNDFFKPFLVCLRRCLTFGRSVRDKFILVLVNPHVGSLIPSRAYEKTGRIPLFSKFNFVCIFFNLIANGGGEFLFAYRVFCSGVMNLKVGFCGKFFTL